MSLQKYMFPFPFFNEDAADQALSLASSPSNLSIWEDEKSVNCEAALPGLKPEEIDITFQKGVLTIRGSQKEEVSDKKRKYYRKSNRTYMYQVAIPGNIDENQEPAASFKNGMMTVAFQKQKKTEPKRIPIKNG